MARSLFLSVSAPTRLSLLNRSRRSNARAANSRVMMTAVKKYASVKSVSAGPIPPKELLQVVELAAKAGAEVYSPLS